MIAVRKRFAFDVHSLCRIRSSVVKLVKVTFTMNEEPIVSVKEGKLRGGIVKGVLETSYIAFKGIPFAAPPVGELRFKDPQPPAPWSGIKDTSQTVGYSCTQLEELPPYNVIGKEDCLYLNVYTNSLNQSKPVMFWIHGGAYIVGSGSYKISRPDYLLTKDVVLVTANYRLGAFGFLNLGHTVAPGNQGLKDLIMALKWVKENIANFGGDPDNVTIFGPSAGGALTHFLLLSPRARGLFHKAIMQSGLVTCSWTTNQSRPERGFKLASILGKDSTDPVEVVEFLRKIPAADIAKSTALILTTEETHSFHLPFAPNTDEIAEDSVLPLPIDKLLSTDVDIPVMIGYTSHEFIMFFKDKSQAAMNIYNQFLPQHVKNLAALRNLGPEETEELLKTVKEKYFNNEPIGEDNIDKLVEFIGDVYFGYPAKLCAEDRVKRTSAPTYLYRYSYVGNEKTATDLLVKRLVTGASHVDEVSYLFYLPLCKTENPDPPAPGSEDRTTMERMTTMWSNFARTSNPTPVHDDCIQTTWEPVTKDKLCYLDIGDELQLLTFSSHILNS
ncbi:esterase FE4-like [Osmia bicornis bicornis]|uniref:esterase FE4-like n=1 Tax=Osmia bicornis bicornis TaxID=1437191 RepID=UPI001EAEEB2A|nr:esterase FE4-like [Osmia bicornis bicornis]